MKTMLKNGLDLIVKMCVTQIGMTMFGLMLSFATKANETLLLISSIFSIIFYLFLLYVHTWEHGARERLKVDGGRLKYRPLTGLYLSLIANSLNIILGITALIGQLGGGANTTEVFWASDMYSISNMIYLMLNGMYVGINKLYLLGVPGAFLIFVCPALIMSTLSYYLGFKNIGQINKKISSPVKYDK